MKLEQARLQSTLQLLEKLPDTNTGSDAAFRLASAWLDECLQNHKSCPQTASAAGDPALPHRVIDVGPPGGSDEPYLLETCGQTGQYIALSHCWGGGHPIQTTKANVQDHRAQVRLAGLPRTFRDAVNVTRRLGFRYLWIDSLCIIQDDEKDWETEAALMHQYYKQSLLTIAAADGRNSDDGLFRDRERLRYQACELDIPGPDGSSQRVYAFTNSMSFELKRSSLSDSFKPFPLYSRAWVFQEQMLSPRTMTYARDRMAWRCQEVLFDERAPLVKRIEDFINDDKATNVVSMGGDPRSTDITVSEFQKKWVFPAQSNPSRPRRFRNVGYHKENCFPPEDEFLLDWGDTVREYTERSMTFQKDKLIAIHGIADAVASVVAKTYFAGVWVESHKSILMGLLWSSSRRKAGHPRLDIAPSWSWASTAAEVSWPGHWLCHLESRIDIIDLKRSGTAAKAEAELVVKAHLRPGRNDENGGFAILAWPSVQAADTSSPRTWQLDSRVTPVALDEQLAKNTPVWFAEVVAGEVHAQGNRKDLHCLVLVACGEKSIYRRIGYSIWRESDWMSTELPERRKMKLVIV